jgi:hypothetical protein
MDTAQALAPAETDRNQAIENAADAFKAFTTGEPVQLRSEDGRFASPVEEETVEIDEAGEVAEVEADDDDGEEAAEQAQPMPPSWPADKAEVWEALPADAKAFVAERDAEQIRATNAKFQESANARKAAEAALAEAQTNRNQYLEAIDQLSAVLNPVKPDPRAFGAGTGQYNREAFDLAQLEYDQQSQALAQLTEQREAITRQQTEEANEQFKAWKSEHEAQYAPKLLADVPELTDTAKAEPLVRDLVTYAIQNGVPEELFAPEMQDQITSAQLHLLWKARQFDQLRASPAQAKPKPAGPAVKPGVSSPRSAQRIAGRQRDMDRLNREGSIEAGAAVFKHLFKG